MLAETELDGDQAAVHHVWAGNYHTHCRTP